MEYFASHPSDLTCTFTFLSMSAAPKRRPAGGLKPISIIGKRPVDKTGTVRPSKRGPQAFPLRNTPPPDVTSEDEREAEEEEKRQEERRKRKKRDRVLAEAGNSSVLKVTGRQDVKKSKVERKEEEECAVGGGTKPRKPAIPPPGPHPRESKCDSAGPSRVDGKAAKDRVQARLRGDPSSPPPLGALLIKTKGRARQDKAEETPKASNRRIDPLDRWASVTDSPDPLELSAIAVPAKKATVIEGFPLPDPTSGTDAFPLSGLTPTVKRIRRIISPSPDGVSVTPRVGDGHAFFEFFGKVSEEAGDSGEMQVIDHSM